MRCDRTVADCAKRLDEAGLGHRVAEFAAQIGHVSLDRSFIGIGDEASSAALPGPESSHEVGFAANLRGRLEEGGEKLELGPGEQDRMSIDGDAVCGAVDDESGIADQRLGSRCRRRELSRRISAADAPLSGTDRVDPRG